MGKLAITESKITAVADAIRSKLSESDTYTLDQMPDKIKSISGGATEPYVEYTYNTDGDIIGLKTYGFTNIGAYMFPGTAQTGASSYTDTAYSKLTSAEIGSGTLKLGMNTFWKSNYLTTVTLPSSLQAIGSYAFQGDGGLLLSSLPSSLQTIGNYAFSTCKNISITELPEGIISLGTQSFNGCTSIKTLWIPSSCTTIIGSSATTSTFRGCTGIKFYCEAESQPSEWGAYWNYTASSTIADTTWGVSLEEYHEIIGS